jgi:hypothetical protein
MKTIEIEQIRKMLQYSDLRGVRTWCEKNDVLIVKQGKMEFVFEPNFAEAYEKPLINKLKAKFGKDWESVYLLYKDGNVPALITLQDVPEVKYKAYKSENKVFNKYNEKYKSLAKRSAA